MFSKLIYPLRVAKKLFSVNDDIGFQRKSAKAIQERITKVLSSNCNTNYTQRSKDIKSLLKSGLKDASCDVESYLIKLAAGIVQIRFANGVIDENIHKEIHQTTEQLSADLLPVGKWFNFSYILICNGMFLAGLKAREKAIEAIYNDISVNKCDTKILELGLRAALDQNQIKISKDITSRIHDIRGSNRNLISIEDATRRLSGYQGSIDLFPDQMKIKNNLGFYDYLRDKSVAIVGPAASEIYNGEEIDSFDVVVRFSYSGKPEASDVCKVGRKVHISYYANVNAARVNNLQCKGFHADLNFVVFKSIKHKFQRELLEGGKGRMLFSLNPHLLVGSANLLQLALFDLIHFPVKNIKVFNFNLFLAKILHDDGYMTQRDRSEHKYKLFEDVFAHHNMFCNYNFTRNLWNNGLIEVDDVSRNVLELGPEGYAREMWKIHFC